MPSVSRPPSSVLRHLSSTGGEPVDWYSVTTIAAEYGLTPLLCQRLKESDVQTSVPAGTWERLRKDCVAGAIRSLRVHRELRPVLRRLSDSSIPVIMLKGAFLAEVVYSDPALRPSMADVDFMVPKGEMPRAQAVLLDMGFAPGRSKTSSFAPGQPRDSPRSPTRASGLNLTGTSSTPLVPSR